MQKPTHIPAHIQSLADRAVAGRRGWSGGMTMTAGPSEPDAAAAAAAAAQKAQADAAAAAAAAATAGAPKEATDAEGRALGFPAETPVEKMTAEQSSAYWRNQSRVQERERRAWQDTFGGKKPDEIKAALDAAAQAAMTEQEKAIAAAREEGVKQGQQSGVATTASETAMLLLESYLEHREPDEDRRKTLIGIADISKVVGEDGKVDAAKVKTIAEALAPKVDVKSGGRDGRSTDVGAGRRTSSTGTGIAAGRDLFAERHPKTSDS